MKNLSVILVVLIIFTLALAGCGEEAVSPDVEEQGKPTEQTPTESIGSSEKEDNGYYLIIPKNSWEVLMWDRVSSPHLAYFTLIKEIGEIPIDENGNFEISYSGEFYKDEKATVTFNKFELSGKLDDVTDLATTANGAKVGTGRIDMELHYRMDETHEVKPMYLDTTYTISDDLALIVSNDGTILKVDSEELIHKKTIITYIKSEYVSKEYQEESESVGEYIFNEEFDIKN